jgi:ribose transport system ATP-binding protein
MTDVRGSSDALVVRGVSKAFGATKALVDANLSVRAGEVHALLGENGAGKSTLLALLAGLASRDGGTIELDGRPFEPASPAASRAAGVAMVPQEPTLAPHLTVAENILLGALPTRFGLVSQRECELRASRVLASLGASIRPDALASSLSKADQQIVSVARAIEPGHVKVLVLDEPTSSLAAAESTRVLALARSLAEGGKAVILVSHHLGEVMRTAARYTVLRSGRTVGAGEIEGVTAAELAEHIVGRKLDASSREEPAGEAGPVVLEVRDVTGVNLPRGASLELRRGRILGIAGLVGSGRTELVRAIFALDRVRSGVVRVAAGGSRELHASARPTPSRRLDEGVGMVSEDRKGEGVLQPMSVADNLTLTKLGPFTRLGWISDGAQDRAAEALIERLAVRAAGPRAAVSSLSGGNQQKVALGRLLHHDVDVLLLDEPTRGIDPGSREQIYRIVRELARAGRAVLWISSQLDELIRVSDDIAVMQRGVLSEARDARGFDEATLLRQAGGA